LPEETDAATGATGIFGLIGRVAVRAPWLVIILWIGLAAGLNQAFPSLAELAQRAPAAILPSDAPSTVATRQMTEAFTEASSENILLVVLTNDNGLSPADETLYRDLVGTMRADSADVAAVQDFISTPPLREVLASQDGKAWLIPVNITGELGTPKSTEAARRVMQTVRDAVAGTPVRAYLTGPSGTLSDIQDIGEGDRIRIEVATIVGLLVILLMVYRNLVTMLLPLISIAVSLLTAQGAVAGLGTVGLDVSSQTIVLLTAILAGAGTDYAVFLISRYHDYLRLGATSDQAVQNALGSVGKVITASAATVAVTFLGMVFTKLTVFSTVGVALAVAIAVGCLGAVTLLPAMLVLTGRRGWVKPRRDLTSRFWKKSGIRIVRRPVSHLVASLLILTFLASLAGLARYNYDDRKALPPSTESILGYDAISRHFSVASSLPQYLLVTSPTDLRTPKALADMEQMAYRISQLPDIEMVRGITRPSGESLEQARLSFQAGEVGGRLGDTSNLINSRTAELNMLASGADQIADVLGAVRGQLGQTLATVGGLVQALSVLQNQFGGDQPLQDFDTANKLLDAMHALGNSLGTNVDDALRSFNQSVDPVLNALTTSPVCNADPACVAARGQLQQAAAARNNGTLDRIADLGRQLEAIQGNQTLGATADSLTTALDSVNQTLAAAGLQSPADVQAQLSQLDEGITTLADGSRKVADGVQLLVDQTKNLGAGLDQASSFLLGMKTNATTPSMAGFYIPAQILTGDEFKKAAQIFISPDGRTARYLIQTKLNPFSAEAMDQVNDVLATAREAQPNTTLADASVSMTGFTVTLRDTRDYYYQDLRLIVVVTILVVLSILIVLLRALVAPLYLILSVVISYLSALGLGVLTFQVLMGQELHWSVPGLTFIILVAVGADYNLLLISRIREESPHGIRSGVIRTVSQTGGVITAAGLIFAAAMLGLQFASITTLVQIGFIIGVGILLDTFLVRTITVPATAVVVGKANWWPSKWVPPAPARRRTSASSETVGVGIS
jgi:RND superfamily putative drug exporter